MADRSVRALCRLSGIARPHVIITNFNRALKNSLGEQFPGVQQQLCMFHMNKNVVANIKAKWSQNQAKDMVNDTHEAATPPLFPINKPDVVRNLNQLICDDIQISDIGSGNTT